MAFREKMDKKKQNKSCGKHGTAFTDEQNIRCIGQTDMQMSSVRQYMT